MMTLEQYRESLGIKEGERFVPPPTPQPAPRQRIAREHRPLATVIPASGEYGNFVAFLNANGYTLHVRVRPESNGATRSETEYREWCGEDLPEDAIRTQPHKLTVREWRLRAQIGQHACPFPVVPVSSLFSIPREDAGLLYPGGGLEVNRTGIIAELVRAGLRTNPPEAGKERHW